MILLAEGTDIRNLGSFENLIPEGAPVRFIARLSEPLYDNELDGIWDEIESHGVMVLNVRQKGDKLIIDAEKHLGPLLFIGAALALFLVLPTMVFSWRLFMMDPKDMFKSIVLPIGVVSIIGMGIIAYIGRPHAKKVGKVTLEKAPGVAKAVALYAKKAAPYVAMGARKAIMKV